MIRAIFVRLMRPIVVLIGKIHSPYSVKSAAKYYHELVDVLEIGDVILATTYGHLSNVFNPGKWKHAILFIGTENGIPMIIEAIGAGVVKRSLVECLSEKDCFAVVRCNELKGKNWKKAIKWANEQVGKPYDYSFEMSGKHKFDFFFCSELCLATWKIVKKNLKFTLMKTFGVLTASPGDFYKAAPKKTTIVMERDV